MNTVERNCILNAETVRRKLRRMAFEIVERNTDEQHYIIAGINGNGEVVAKNIIRELKQITSAALHFLTIQLNKKQPLEVAVNKDIDVNDKVLIIADDVANSGRTMLYALKPFLQFQPKKIQTLTLVERSHKLFPIQSDYVGLSISTTLHEHITVETDGEEIRGAWLY